jgi:Glycosyltransferase
MKKINEGSPKTAVIGTVGVPASYGGFETLVDNLIEGEKVNYIIYCSSKSYEVKLERYKNAALVYVPLNANGISSIPYDIYSILHAVIFKKIDTLLILGVSGCLVLPLIKKITSTKVITNIDGLEWRRDKWGKLAKLFLKWSEKIAVKNSDIIIADNQEISNYVFSEYGINAKVITYGGDHAIVGDKSVADNISSESNSYALALCRIEPENNVHIILEAFVGITNNLKFIGNWNKSDYGRRLKEKYSRYPNIEILDPIYDVETLNYIRRSCDFYIHGHSAGGTNPSLVEMMFFAKPIICFDCKYNRFTTYDQAEYFNDSVDLQLKIKAQKDKMQGEKLKMIANQYYTWDKIREQYEQLL